jgi:transposase InsO family protein
VLLRAQIWLSAPSPTQITIIATLRLEEFTGLDEAHEKLSAWTRFYNHRYLHSALGYKSLQEYELIYREPNLEKAA